MKRASMQETMARIIKESEQIPIHNYNENNNAQLREIYRLYAKHLDDKARFGEEVHKLITKEIMSIRESFYVNAGN